MIFNIERQRKASRMNTKEFMPPLLTFGILVFVFCFVMSARMIANPFHEKANIPVFSEQERIVEDRLQIAEQNHVSEQKLREQVSVILKLFHIHEDTEEYDLLDHMLQEKMLSEYQDFAKEELELFQNKMHELQEVMNLERVSHFYNMSFEGRELIIYISREIFQLFGYDLLVNLEGDIETLTELSGKIIYSKNEFDYADIQIRGFVIVLSILALSLLICILIAKKNQLFVKEVRYDGLNRKRYA